MAKTLNALIYPSAPTVIVERRMIDVSEIPPHKAAWWRPVVVVGNGPVDGETQKRTGPFTTIEPDRVVDTFSIVPLTAQELDQLKENQIPPATELMFRVLFNHENRVRALEGKAAITAAQFRAALKAML